MFRYLVAHVPTFRLDRCGWPPNQAVILVTEERNALRVQAATPAALQAGICPGMSVAAARAMVPSVETELLNAESEAADLSALTSQLLRVSPSIAALPPDSVVVEITRVPGGHAEAEGTLLERVRARMHQLGHTAHVVIADDPTTALHVARWQRHSSIITPTESATALASLPLQALTLPSKEHSLLEGLGIHTIGAFADLPRAALTGRFSPTILIAHALACGSGSRPTLSPWSEGGPTTLTQELPAPIVEVEALTFVLGALVRDLTTCLIARGQAITQVAIGLRLDGGRQQSVSFRLGAPTRDSTSIIGRIRHRLSDLKLGGAVLSITLTTNAPAPFDGQQVDLRDPRRQNEAIDMVSARLQDALGSRSVLSARAIPRHRPEGAWRPVPFGTPIPCSVGSAAMDLTATHSADPVVAWEGHPDLRSPDRPPILLSPAQAIEVDTGANGQLSAVHVDGQWQMVTQLLGPEQISGEWWMKPFQRTYWQATLESGKHSWLYREHGRWWLHGWWDR